MESVFYENTTYWVLFVCLASLAVFVSLMRAARASTGKLVTGGALFSVAIVVVHWLVGGQHIFPTGTTGSIFYLVILSGAMSAVILYYVTVREEFFSLPQDYLQIAQGFRVFIGAGFLMEGVLDVIPGWFSILDGYLHIASGFLALVAAAAFLKDSEFKRQWLWLANIVGLVDILVIVTSICFLVWPELGPHHNMMYIVFITGPLLLWIHFVSMMKLLSSNDVIKTVHASA